MGFNLHLFTELSQLEDLNTNRITRILTTDFPQYFAIVSRIRQEVHAIGPEGKKVFLKDDSDLLGFKEWTSQYS